MPSVEKSEENIGDNTTAEEECVVNRRTFVAPWKNVAEFKKVYSWLFGERVTVETKRRAISQMRVWTMRRSDLCPAAVLGTTVMLRVQLQDAESNVDNLQVLYASAFTRFFNFMSSIMQTHNLRTMYETAEQLGLQSFVVDLRHLCAHGQQLPPLDVLRSTSTYCLRWLHDYYWREQCEKIRDVDASNLRPKNKTQFNFELTTHFDIYDAALESYLKGAVNLMECKKFVRGKRFTQLKEFCAAQQLSNIKMVFNVVVRKVSSLMRRDVAIKDLVEIFIEAMLQMKCFFILAQKTHGAGEELEVLLDVTRGFFCMLALNGYIEDVFNGLLEVAENPNMAVDKRRGACFWATQIAQGFVALHRMKQMHKKDLDNNPKLKQQEFSTLNTKLVSKAMRQLLLRAGVNTQRTLLFGDTVRRPHAWVFKRAFIDSRLAAINEFTAPVLQCLLPLIEPALSISELRSWSNIFDIYTKSFEELNEKSSLEVPTYTSDDTIHEAKDLLKIVKRDKRKPAVPVELQGKKFGIWSVPLDNDNRKHNWAVCPLGRLPWE